MPEKISPGLLCKQCRLSRVQSQGQLEAGYYSPEHRWRPAGAMVQIRITWAHSRVCPRKTNSGYLVVGPGIAARFGLIKATHLVMLIHNPGGEAQALLSRCCFVFLKPSSNPFAQSNLRAPTIGQCTKQSVLTPGWEQHHRTLSLEFVFAICKDIVKFLSIDFILCLILWCGNT